MEVDAGSRGEDGEEQDARECDDCSPGLQLLIGSSGGHPKSLFQLITVSGSRRARATEVAEKHALEVF